MKSGGNRTGKKKGTSGQPSLKRKDGRRSVCKREKKTAQAAGTQDIGGGGERDVDNEEGKQEARLRQQKLLSKKAPTETEKKRGPQLGGRKKRVKKIEVNLSRKRGIKGAVRGAVG